MHQLRALGFYLLAVTIAFFVAPFLSPFLLPIFAPIFGPFLGAGFANFLVLAIVSFPIVAYFAHRFRAQPDLG